MNNRIALLSGLLLVQVLIAALFWFDDGSEDAAGAALLEIDAASLTALTVSDGKQEVTVTRTDDGWRVGGLPADEDKVSRMLDKLESLNAPWPVATTEASAARFEVTEDEYQRRLVLQAGDEEAARLYLGTSPGFQRVHARRQGSDDIYSVELSNYELPVNVDGWLDKGLLALADAPDRVSLRFTREGDQDDLAGPAERTIERSAEGWLFNGAAADQDAAASYVNRFTTMQVLGVASASDSDDKPLQPVATLVARSGDAERVFEFSRYGEDGDYVVRDAGGENAYRVASYIAEQLLMTDAQFAADGQEDVADAESAE